MPAVSTASAASHTTDTAPAAVNGHNQLLIVDLGGRQSAKKVKKLRKGRGKLAGRVDQIVADLVAAGTLKADVQPVVIVVREKPDLPKLF